jgi:hypothetical protein
MRTWTRWGVALAVSAALASVCGGAQAQNAAGDWHGTITSAFGTFPVGVTLKAKAGGGYEGSWIGPRATTPLKEAKVDKGILTFSFDTGSYSGHWDEARKAWVGQLTPKPKVLSGFVGAPPGGAAPPPFAFPPPAPLDLALTAGKP